MNKKIKATLLSMAISTGLALTPTTANATLPTVDPANLAENIVGNIQDAANWVSESGLMTMAMELESMYSQAMMQLDGMLGMVEIQKTLKLEEEIHNLWVKEINEPDPMAAKDCAVQAVGEAVDCHQIDQNVAKLDKDQAEASNFTDTQEEARERTELANKEIIDKCMSLTFGEIEEGKSPLSKSYCLSGGLLSGAGVGNAYNKDQKDASQEIIKILGGTATEFKESNSLPDDSPMQAEARLKEMRHLAIRSLALSSLQHVAGVRSSASENSRMQTSTQLSVLEDFDNQRWGSEEWIKMVGANTGDADTVLTPTVLQRQQAKMQAFMIHLEIIKYKQQLRMENLQAVNTLMNADAVLEDQF